MTALPLSTCIRIRQVPVPLFPSSFRHLACIRRRLGITSSSSSSTTTMLTPEERSEAIAKLKQPSVHSGSSSSSNSSSSSSSISGKWEDMLPDRNAITKTFDFSNFHQAWNFMSQVAKLAETMNHHPEWYNCYNKVQVTLTTHDCNNSVSEKDISMAQSMDAYASAILSKKETEGTDEGTTATTTTPSTAVAATTVTTTTTTVTTTEHDEEGKGEEAVLTFQPTCDLYDEYLDHARVPFCVGNGGSISFQHFGGKKQFCGRAVTVKCFEDNSRIKELVETMSGTGKVLVVDGGGSQRVALLGDMVASKAMKNGWEGLIIYGNVRDIQELQQFDQLGIMALGCTPRKSVRRGEGQVNIDIQIGNVWCYPNDKVYVDENGILFLPK